MNLSRTRREGGTPRHPSGLYPCRFSLFLGERHIEWLADQSDERRRSAAAIIRELLDRAMSDGWNKEERDGDHG